MLKECLHPYVKWRLSLLNFNLKCNTTILIYTTCQIKSKYIILLHITYKTTKTWNKNIMLKTEAVWHNQYWCCVLICDRLSQRHEGSWQWVALEFRGWKGKTWQQCRTKGTSVTCVNFLHLLYTLYQSIHNI
jgi:hypothetical protein